MGWARRSKRDTGWLDVTSRIDGHVSGTLHLRRVDSTVWVRFGDLVVEDPSNTWATFPGLIPSGFRHELPGFSFFALPMQQSSVYTSGPLRMDRSGNVVVYGVQGGKRVVGVVSWVTDEPMPINMPGVSI